MLWGWRVKRGEVGGLKWELDRNDKGEILSRMVILAKL